MGVLLDSTEHKVAIERCREIINNQTYACKTSPRSVRKKWIELTTSIGLDYDLTIMIDRFRVEIKYCKLNSSRNFTYDVIYRRGEEIYTRSTSMLTDELRALVDYILLVDELGGFGHCFNTKESAV